MLAILLIQMIGTFSMNIMKNLVKFFIESMGGAIIFKLLYFDE